MTSASPKRESAYDRYIDYRRFVIAVAAFVVLIAIPIPESMLDVAVEYSMGKTYVLEFYSEELFGKELDEAEQWEKLTAQALEALMRQGALSKTMVMRREPSQLESMGIEVSPRHYESYRAVHREIDEESFQTMMRRAYALRHDELTFDHLTDAAERNAPDGSQAHPGLGRDGGLRRGLLRHRGDSSSRCRLLHRPDTGLLGNRRQAGSGESLLG